MSKQRTSTTWRRRRSTRPRVQFVPCYRDERMLEGICRYAAEAGWVLDTLYYHTSLLPARWEGDGIVCMLHVPGENPALRAFVKAHRHIPTVDLSANDPSLRLPRVLQDNPAIGRMGAEYLASLGCRHLGFVLHNENHFHRERFEAFQDAGERLGRTVACLRAPSDFVTRGGAPSWFLPHVPDANERPFGVMAAADYLTQWVTSACGRSGLRIPDDVALLGVDDCREICELSPVAISSIDNNAFRHGYEAAALLDRLMRGEPPPRKPLRVPAGALHVRQSTDVTALRHPHVAAVMRWVGAHYTDPALTPERVAARVPMSRRRLHDAFRKHVGRSIYQEILHRRLQHALRLIRETDQKLWDVAELSGFGSAELLSRLFQRALGHPPSSFRQPSPPHTHTARQGIPR